MNKTLGGQNTPSNPISIKALSLALHLALPNNQRTKIAWKSTAAADEQKHILQTEVVVPSWEASR